MGAYKQSTKIQYEERVNFVLNLIICGFERIYDIHQFIASQHKKEKIDWMVSQRQVAEYIEKAQEIIRNQKELERDVFLKDATLKIKDLYRKNMALGKYGECRLLLLTLSSLHGFDSQRIFINNETDEKEVDEKINKFLAMREQQKRDALRNVNRMLKSPDRRVKGKIKD